MFLTREAGSDIVSASDPARSAVRRSAIYLESRGESLFGWLHARGDAPLTEHAIVICAPLGHEQLHAHRGLRHLADSLAETGVPVLRFDWHGTGDSAGSDGDPARCATWLANVGDAISWLRGELGSRRITLVGLRLGATLAAVASTNEEVENLVLWAPVVKGRAYVREQRAIDLTGESRPIPPLAAAGDIEAGGFLLSEETAAELSEFNLLQSEPRCRRVLLVDSEVAPADRGLCVRFAALGIPADLATLPGLDGMLAEPHRGSVPVAAIRGITEWIQSHRSSSQDDSRDSGTPRGTASVLGSWNNLPLRTGASPSEMVLRQRGEIASSREGRVRERPLQISSRTDLFGILSEPENVRGDLPAILLLNAGSAYRIGPGRLHVHLGRDLAMRGFRVLRLDLGGLGDSPAEHAPDENDCYAETVFRDIQATLQYLRESLGVRRYLVMGLCSGAYAAFQSAVQFSDPALLECVLINPLTFFWKRGMSLETNPVRNVVTQNYYLNAARKPEKWLRLLSGKSRIGLLQAGRLLVERLAAAKRQPRDAAAPQPAANSSCAPLGHPQQPDLPGDLSRLTAAGRSISFYFSRTDPGYRILTSGAGSLVKTLRKSGQLRLSFIENADHTFSRRVPRSALIQEVGDDLQRRYPAIN